MIIFLSRGRLGNQILQHNGITIYFPDHNIHYCGFKSLYNFIKFEDNNYIKRYKICDSNRCYRFVKSILTNLAALRIIGSVKEYQNNDYHNILKIRGLIPNIYYLNPAFFQHKELLNNPPLFHIQNEILKKAEEWLISKDMNHANKELVFIHVRRGDYTNWPTPTAPAVLQLDWYKRQIHAMREKLVNPSFIILSDDLYYVKDFFGESKDIVISENNQYIDLALMSLCSHGILSPSSLSLCGAWMSRFKIKNGNNENGHYIAPIYWIGHRMDKWFPNGIDANWITFAD